MLQYSFCPYYEAVASNSAWGCSHANSTSWLELELELTGPGR